jgi:hypothetical protein
MEDFDYWQLCDELTVFQAAMLAADCDPSSQAEHCRWFEAAKNAISNALRRGAVTGKLVPIIEKDYDAQRAWEIEDSIDIHKSRVEVDSLRKWLATRGVKGGFFFPDAKPHDYLDPNHPRYAPKLAAAVRAWMALEDESSISGKSPKQALTKWLREHASEFELTDEDGKPNETGIEEAAKVANWQRTGGAPKTPFGNPPTH